MKQLTILLVFLMLSLASYSQDIESLGLKKGVKVNGSVNLNSVLYTVSGIEQRRDPFNWFLTGNLNISYIARASREQWLRPWRDGSEKLDYSETSLDFIGQLLQNYSSENFLSEENKILLDRLARYVGSTFRRNFPNAYWDIELDDKKDVFFTLPVVKVKDAQLAPFSPHTLVTTLLARKRGNFLSTILENSKKTLKKMKTR